MGTRVVLSFLFFMLFSTINLLAQKVKLSEDSKYLATYFELKKDSVVYITENGDLKEELVRFVKYKISIFDFQKGVELHKYETNLYQLNAKKNSIKFEFDAESKNLFVAIEHQLVLHFSTQKGLVAKYKAADFAFNSEKSEVALLEANQITFLKAKQIIKRKLESFTHIEFTSDNKFIVVSRQAKNLNYYVFINREEPKNNELIKANTYFYSVENEEVNCLKSSKIANYKTSNFKEKESSLEKRFTTRSFKQNYNQAQFSPTGQYIALYSEASIVLISAKGKGVADIRLDDDIISMYWANDSVLKIVSNQKIEFYDVVKQEVIDEISLKINYPKNIQKLSSKDESLNKFCSKTGKFVALNLKNACLVQNTLTQAQVLLADEQFSHFSENENFVFTKDSDFQLNVYNTKQVFQPERMFHLETDEMKMLSTIGNMIFAKAKEKQYYSPDLELLATTYSQVEIDTLIHESGKNFDWVYSELKKKNKEVESKITYKTDYIDALSLFFISDNKSENRTINKRTYDFETSELDTNFFINPIVRNKFIMAKNRQLYLQYSNLKGNTPRINKIVNRKINDLRFTNNQTVILRDNSSKRYRIIDLQSNEELNFLALGEISFSPNNSFVVVSAALKTILYNSLSGKEMRSYPKIYTQNLLTKDTTFFLGMNNVGDYEYVGIKKHQNLNSSIVKLSDNGKFLLTISKDKSRAKLYQLPNLKEVSSVSISDEYKKYFYSPKIEISSNGQFFSCQFKEKIAIFSSQKNNSVQNVMEIAPVSVQKSAFWISDSEVLISRDESSAVFNAETKSYTSKLDFNFYFDESLLSFLKTMICTTFVSENGNYAVAEFKGNGQNYCSLKNTHQKYENQLISNAQFIAFDHESERAFFQIGNNKVAYIETRQLNDAKKELTLHTLKAARRNNRNLPPKPALIETDFDPPVGYHYERFREKKSIDDLNSEIGFYAYNLMSKGNSVNLNLHLLDTEGNFYSSSAKEKNKKIWCEMWLKYPDGKVRKIENFGVKERNAESENLNFALALVLDHSGSMGETRCLYQQKGVQNFIRQKRNNDAVSVLKFDENVEVEAQLNTSINLLLKSFKQNGQMGFGGSTALYDAIYEGISEVSKSTNRESKRAVIVITDGYENSSYTYLNELILYALENNVQVHTVGFGALVNKPILQSIAYQTGGNFYEIYKTEDFSWIFEDVYNKMSNYYSLNFVTPQKGKYTLMLKSCDEHIKNNLILAFDNSEVNFKNVKEFDEDGFGIPFINLSDSFDISSFESDEAVPNIDQIVSKNGSNIKFYTHNEFENIVFPDIKFVTDKTQIIKGTDEGLQEVIFFMKRHPDIMIEISGHTDEVGTGENNMLLSDRRAKRVKQIMVDNGVDSYRIYTIGYGETRPIASNSTLEGKLKNRRVDFKIVN